MLINIEAYRVALVDHSLQRVTPLVAIVPSILTVAKPSAYNRMHAVYQTCR